MRSRKKGLESSAIKNKEKEEEREQEFIWLSSYASAQPTLGTTRVLLLASETRGPDFCLYRLFIKYTQVGEGDQSVTCSTQQLHRAGGSWCLPPPGCFTNTHTGSGSREVSTFLALIWVPGTVLQGQLGWWDVAAPWWQQHDQARLHWDKWCDSKRHLIILHQAPRFLQTAALVSSVSFRQRHQRQWEIESWG